MAFSAPLLTLTPLILLLLSPLIQAQSAPAPAPAGPINITGILDKGGQFTTFIKLLTSTQAANQIENQINNSNQGMTVFAPTDNAFNNLKAGSLNQLNDQEQVQLVQYHILPVFYKLNDLLLVSNPVRTQASSSDGGSWGLNFTGRANQVNVSTGLVETQVNNALRQESPLAVYQVDQVLLPNALFGVKPPSAAPVPSSKTPSSSSNTTRAAADGPTSEDNSGSSGRINMGLGLVAGLALFCVGVVS
ncbi:fasciclin-like arabinogalactan protein 13 [Pistacia vera]|uniref:fasciclin-like arabinogalactan protein 13 n=1 Tax=Pistacia vera TaxID=55513 RepID=UPI0012630AAC|nr:fasciclin-like arabinogalactan protein 13 [Pistacia vera]